MKVWLVFNKDTYDQIFCAACESRETADDWIREHVTAEASRFHWMNEPHISNWIEKSIKEDYRIRPVPLHRGATVGSVGTETPKPLSDLTPR